MLNRHAIVLNLGLGVVFVLVGAPEAGLSWMGLGILLSVVGLLLDDGLSPWRVNAGHLFELHGVAMLSLAAARQLLSGASWPLPAAGLGIGIALLGVLLEMRLSYGRLRATVAMQAAGDALFAAGFAGGVLERELEPSLVGWVGVGLAGAISLYAAAVNLVLQASRLRDPGAGWRYRVLGADAGGLSLRTPGGPVNVRWSHVEGMRPLGARHLLLVLPSPLPEDLARADLPVEELRESDQAPEPGSAAPDRYALVLHEQELGAPVPKSEEWLRPFVAVR